MSFVDCNFCKCISLNTIKPRLAASLACRRNCSMAISTRLAALHCIFPNSNMHSAVRNLGCLVEP